MVFFDNIQHVFYSAYFAGHGIKMQVVSLPNGMVGSVFFGSWRVSDAGMVNMSGLDGYLSALFREFHLNMPHAHGQLSALCGDGIFPGIGVPAVALSGASAANSMISPLEHWQCLDRLKAKKLI